MGGQLTGLPQKSNEKKSCKKHGQRELCQQLPTMTASGREGAERPRVSGPNAASSEREGATCEAGSRLAAQRSLLTSPVYGEKLNCGPGKFTSAAGGRGHAAHASQRQKRRACTRVLVYVCAVCTDVSGCAVRLHVNAYVCACVSVHVRVRLSVRAHVFISIRRDGAASCKVPAPGPPAVTGKLAPGPATVEDTTLSRTRSLCLFCALGRRETLS